MEEVKEWLAAAHEALNFELTELAGASITPLTLLSVLLMLLITYQLSRIAQRGVARGMRRRGVDVNDGTLAVTQRLVSYGVWVIGAYTGLKTLGVDLGALVAAGAVFAVGVGLAMQSLAQNFVSGIILLVEQVIKPGDVVVVDGTTVRVSRMGIRATVCRSRDGDELIVPNSVLVQNIVRNQTLADRTIRVRLPMGVHYDSDLSKVQEVLMNVAKDTPWRLPQPDPVLLLTGFGTSSVDFEVSVWIGDAWPVPQRRTELAFAVWNALAEHDITIAFPQLDVHLDEAVVHRLGSVA